MAVKISQAERMMNLLALLVDRAKPLTLRQVRQELGKQYPESDEAARAAFERDKAALREMGIPIETKTLGGDAAGEVTYWVNRSNYELSDLRLTEPERDALQLAVATVHLGAQHGEEALWKLGGERHLKKSSMSVNIGLVDQNMGTITDAVMKRRTLNFEYKGESRQVDPYGMLSRGGFWYIIGYDHLRRDQRVFRVDRIEGRVVAGEARAFKAPENFEVAAAVPTEKQMLAAGDGEITTATVLVDAALAPGVRREFGESFVVREREDGGVEFAIPCANLGAFRQWLFAMVESAEVLSPPEIRDQVVQWLEELATGA
ncbi:MAG: helix-turn-helix transcriptional regulator [Actinomycetota bacterium]|nr:WYL domain-containing protein [Actinomycetota bacterium]